MNIEQKFETLLKDSRKPRLYSEEEKTAIENKIQNKEMRRNIKRLNEKYEKYRLRKTSLSSFTIWF